MILVTVTLLTLVDCIKGLGYNPYAPARVTLLSMKTSQLMSEQFVMAEAGLVAVCELRVMIRRRDIEWTQVNCLLVNNMGSSSVSSAVEWGEVTHTWAFYYKIGDTVIVLLHCLLSFIMFLFQMERCMRSLQRSSSLLPLTPSLICSSALTPLVTQAPEHPPAAGHGQVPLIHSQLLSVIVINHLHLH